MKMNDKSSLKKISQITLTSSVFPFISYIFIHLFIVMITAFHTFFFFLCKTQNDLIHVHTK